MNPEDLMREVDKIDGVLEAVEKYLTRQNEMNAALHMSDRVMASPLASAVTTARNGCESIRLRICEGQ